MKKTQQLTAVALTLLCAGGFLSSCSDDNPWKQTEEGTGHIHLQLTSAADVKQALPTLTRSQAPDVPQPAEFSIQLERTDGTWSHTYATLADFEAANEFPAGQYTIKAFFGDLSREGFHSPYYYGESQIMVHDERTTEAEITATIANTLVSINYTEAFENYFSGWSATLHTDGYGYVEIPPFTTDVAYIAPGTTAISLQMTDYEGKSTTIQPCTLATLARHHYNITFNVEGGEIGVPTLKIEFDDSLTQEEVNVELTDELFATPKPTLNPTGFTAEETSEYLQGVPTDHTIRMSADARGGIKSAVLTFSSNDFLPPFGSEIDLCSCDAEAQRSLSAMGIEAMGFYTTEGKKPGKLAALDISALPAHLPEGNYKVTLLVKDNFDRVSEPLTASFRILPLEIVATPTVAEFGAGYAVINVEYNGTDTSLISFKAVNNTGHYEDCPIVKVEEQASRAFPTKTYAFTVTLPDHELGKLPMKMLLSGSERQDFELLHNFPAYTLTTDVYSRYATLKITAEDDSKVELVTRTLSLKVTGPSGTATSVIRDPENGLMVLTGIQPGTAYTLTHSVTDAGPQTKTDINAEAETQLPNSNFESLAQTINIQGIQVGGQYNVAPANYTLKSSIVVNEPTGWASINAKTAYTGAKNMNTWFVVPSTLAEHITLSYGQGNQEASSNMVRIRTVAYDHAGTTPNKSGGAFNTTYYCTNAPATIASTAAGELFLGSYSFDGTEHRRDGIEFASRPTAISFDYLQRNDHGINEFGDVEIKVYNANGQVISETTAVLDKNTVTMDRTTIALPAYPFGSKAAKISLRFRSSSAANPATYKPSGSELNEHQSLGNHTMSANSYHALSTGAELIIDNIELHYDIPGGPQNAPKRKLRKTRR